MPDSRGEAGTDDVPEGGVLSGLSWLAPPVVPDAGLVEVIGFVVEADGDVTGLGEFEGAGRLSLARGVGDVPPVDGVAP